MFPAPIQDAIEALAALPGVGSRSAERLVFSLLRDPKKNLSKRIADSLKYLSETVVECEKCADFCEKRDDQERSLCPMCNRIHEGENILCIVESPVDAIAIGRTQSFNGRFQILHGILSPLEKIYPEHLRLEKLWKRIEKEEPEEIIIGLSSNTEAEATSYYLSEELQKRNFRGIISHLSKGIPSSGNLEYLDVGTLRNAFLERKNIV